jgi:hypothetical protein
LARRSKKCRDGKDGSETLTKMSALPPKANMCGALAYVCFGPKADIGCLFDYLVSDLLERDAYCSSIIGLLWRKPMRAFS